MGFYIVTGASKGIGKAFAEELAKKGKSVLLIARSQDLLEPMAELLRKKYHVEAHFLAIDLVKPDFVEKIENFIQKYSLEVEGLVNNAGFGLWKRFDQFDFETLKEMIGLNISSVVELTHKVLELRPKNKPFYILNISSTASFQPVPYFDVYAASKSFILSFSLALKEELSALNVYVSCVCPGPTKTGFFDKAEASNTFMNSGLIKMDPKVVAKTAIDGMFRKKGMIVPGITNKLHYIGASLLPVGLILGIIGLIMVKK